MSRRLRSLALAFVYLMCLLPAESQAVENNTAKIKTIITPIIAPMMARYGIPGMAIGVALNGENYIFNYGVASKTTSQAVSANTLFEIGSISKTFTATLASYAENNGYLSLSDTTGADFPALRGTEFDSVSLLDLGTHASGGLPLQVPDGITTDTEMMAYFRHWKPAYKPGSTRTYSNPSIGLLGLIVATRMNRDFAELEEHILFQPLGMTHTYLVVPAAEMNNYAQGYTETDTPIRMAAGVFWLEAYGIRTTAGDLLRYVNANMGLLPLTDGLRHAIVNTQTGYYKIKPGGMTQDLMWEEYRYPVTLSDLLDGNSDDVLTDPSPVTLIDPALPPQNNVWINKTGSTNGFGDYVAFIPEEKSGIVLLANKRYPIPQRVQAAYQIMTALQALKLN